MAVAKTAKACDDSNSTTDGFLVPTKFRVIFPEMIVDMKDNVQQVEIPSFSSGSTEIRVPTLGAPLKIAGDTASYDDLTMTFILDQDLYIYEMILAWGKACAYPEDTKLFTEFTNFWKGNETNNSDVLLQPITVISKSGYNRDMVWDFAYAFPSSISGINFDKTLTDATVATITVTFSYSYFEFNVAGNSEG